MDWMCGSIGRVPDLPAPALQQKHEAMSSNPSSTKKKKKKEKTNHGIWLSTEKNPKLSSSNVLELIFESSKRM
jgi:hypothetical protein